jgi:hypothetical protein
VVDLGGQGSGASCLDSDFIELPQEDRMKQDEPGILISIPLVHPSYAIEHSQTQLTTLKHKCHDNSKPIFDTYSEETFGLTDHL